MWEDLLKHSFESNVNEVDVVLYTEKSAHTYHIVGGEAVYVGPGRDHEVNAQFQVTGVRINPNYFSNTTTKYFMDVYSTQAFVDSVTLSLGNDNVSNIPLATCIGTVLIMVFTSLLFVLYDYFVRKEFDDNKKLLDAKRQFVRFISHEVRTPLNTVCMGLSLLQHDFAGLLGMHHGRNRTSSRRVLVDNLSGEDDDKGSLVSMEREKVQNWMALSEQVFQNADAAVSVLSDLLNYDKIQMGNLNLELTLVNIWHLLETTRDEFKVAALDRDLKISLDFSPLVCADSTRKYSKKLSTKTAESMTDLPVNVRFFKVVADEIRMQQVLRNLISNALKFSRPKGNLIIRVDKKTIPKRKRKAETVSLCTGDSPTVTQVGNILINVIDDGVGMTPEQVKTVFDEGTQFNANRFQAGGGSGLGLNIARGIVIQHDGHLTCNSSGPGKGTTFTIDLPIYDLHSAEISGESVNAQLGGHSHLDAPSQFLIEEEDSCHLDASIVEDAPNKAMAPTIPEESFSENEVIIPQLRILVVDDSITNRKFCMRLLERKGHTTEGACDGKVAVDMVQESLQSSKNYDCILLDYEMPHMRGPEACKKMREMGCSSFIVGVTGNVMSDDVNHFRNCGANWVLPKPFRLEALEEQLIEHDVFPSAETDQKNGIGIVRVESGSKLVEMGDQIALDINSGTTAASSSSTRSDFE